MPRDDYDYSHKLTSPSHKLLLGVRQLLIVCVFALLIMSGETAAAVGRTRELRQESYHPYLRPAMMSVPVWASLAFVVSRFSITYGTKFEEAHHPLDLRRERNFFMISGIVDLALMGALITLTVLQTYFLPHPLGKCLSEGLREIGQSGDHGRSYFDAIANRHGRGADENGLVSGNARHSWCNRFVNNWRLQIAISIMMGCIALICLYAALVRRGVGSRAEKRFSNRLNERLIGLEAVTIGAQAGGVAVSELNNHTTSNLACGSELYKQISATAIVPVSGLRSGEYLERILGQYELLCMFASGLHCSDIGNVLSLSRGIRSAIIGAGISPRALLHKGLCYPKEPSPPRPRTTLFEAPFPYYPSVAPTQPPEPVPRIELVNCLGCGDIMCSRCPYYDKYLGYETIRHVRDCEPHCDTCYKKKFCFAPRAGAGQEGYMLPGRCDWNHVAAHTRRIPDPNQPDDSGNSEYAPPIRYIDILATQFYSTSMRLCVGCRDKSDPKLASIKLYDGQKMRFRLVKSEETSGYKQCRAKLQCGGCKKEMQTGERLWWGCYWCGKECTDDFHKHAADLIVP